MVRIVALLFGAAALATPARADNEMKQSPLLFHRAGPSCRAGDLGGQDGAGYGGYLVGPCLGVDPSPAPEKRRLRGSPGRRR